MAQAIQRLSVVHVVPDWQLDDFQPQPPALGPGSRRRRCPCSRRCRRTTARAAPSYPTSNSRHLPPVPAPRGRSAASSACAARTRNRSAVSGCPNSAPRRGIARDSIAWIACSRQRPKPCTSGGIGGEPSASTRPVPAARCRRTAPRSRQARRRCRPAIGAGPRGASDVLGDVAQERRAERGCLVRQQRRTKPGL